MITGEIKSKVDRIWDTLWSGGISNPLTIIEQLTYLLFITRRLAIMNLALRGIEADIGKEHADTFRNVQHSDLRADYVLANPPFNDSDRFLGKNAGAGRTRAVSAFEPALAA